LIAYIESNFFLEIALRQQQTGAAEAILALAEQQKVELICPAFSLSEPFSTLSKREADRRRLSKSLNETLRDLSRSTANQGLVSSIKPAADILINIAKTELDALQVTMSRFLQVGRTLETTADILGQAQTYQTTFALSPQDSIIYAAIIHDLDLRKGIAEKKCFISRNWKDFRVPRILGQLTSLNCMYWERFDDAQRFLQS